MIKALKKDSAPSDFRLWYNDWVEENAFGVVLDVGKSQYWDYDFPTIDINKKLNPTFVGNIEKTDFADGTYDVVMCNGMYECVDNPQKMVNEVMRILKPGGKAIFGFVGEGYKPYKKPWRFYKEGDIEFRGRIHSEQFIDVSADRKSQSNQYHFIIVCKK